MPQSFDCTKNAIITIKHSEMGIASYTSCLLLALSFAHSELPTITVATYTVEVRELRKEPSLLRFEKGEKGASVYKTFGEELAALGTVRDEADVQHLIHVTDLHSDKTDYWGWLRRGQYGAEIKIYNKETLKQTHVQTADEAAMWPFYFRLHLPDGSTKGLLLLQRSGTHGAFTDLHRTLAQGFSKKHEHHRVHFAQTVHPDILAGMLAGKFHSFELVTHKVPSDLADMVKNKGATKQKLGNLKVTVTAEAPRGSVLWETPPKFLNDILKEGKTIASLYPKEEIEAFRVKMTYKGKPRTFDLSNPEDVFPAVIVNDKIEFGSDGHPTFDSIDEVCLELRDDLASALGITT